MVDFMRDLGEVLEGAADFRSYLPPFTVPQPLPGMSDMGQQAQMQAQMQQQMQVQAQQMQAQQMQMMQQMQVQAQQMQAQQMQMMMQMQAQQMQAQQMQAQQMSSQMPPPVSSDFASQMVMGMQMAQSQYHTSLPQAAFQDPQGLAGYAPASMMTTPSAGVFRTHEAMSYAPAPYTVTGEAFRSAMFPTPYGSTQALGFDTFERTRAPLNFVRGYDARIESASEYVNLLHGQYADISRDAGRFMAQTVGATVVGGVASIAGMFMGPKGAIAMGLGGAALGSQIDKVPGVVPAMEMLFRPAIEQRFDTMHGQMASRQFMTSAAGGDLDLTGSGLTGGAAHRMMRDFEEISRSTGGSLTRKDLMDITQMSGEQGLLDFASNSDEIVKTVKGLTALLGTMAKITGDPDFHNNIKLMGQLRRFGFSTNNMDTAMLNMDMYSRQTGRPTVDVVSHEGTQGGAVYQSAGLGVKHGVETGVMTAGQAHTASQSHIFTEQQLSRYGGESGVAQHLMEANAAFLAGPTANSLLPYFIKKGEDGTAVVDTAAVNLFKTGGISLSEALQQGARKVHGDRDLLLSMNNRKGDLVDTISETMTPEGVQQALLHSAVGLAEKHSLSLPAALQMLGLDADKARLLSTMHESPEYQQNIQAHMQIEIDRRMYDEFAAGRNRLEAQAREDSKWGITKDWEAFSFSPLEGTQNWAAGAMTRSEENLRYGSVGKTLVRDTGRRMTAGAEAAMLSGRYEGVLPEYSAPDRDGVGRRLSAVFLSGTEHQRMYEATNTSRFWEVATSGPGMAPVRMFDMDGDGQTRRLAEANATIAATRVAAGISEGDAVGLIDIWTGKIAAGLDSSLPEEERQAEARRQLTAIRRGISDQMAEHNNSFKLFSPSTWFKTSDNVTDAEVRKIARAAGMTEEQVNSLDAKDIGELMAQGDHIAEAKDRVVRREQSDIIIGLDIVREAERYTGDIDSWYKAHSDTYKKYGFGDLSAQFGSVKDSDDITDAGKAVMDLFDGLDDDDAYATQLAILAQREGGDSERVQRLRDEMGSTSEGQARLDAADRRISDMAKVNPKFGKSVRDILSNSQITGTSELNRRERRNPGTVTDEEYTQALRGAAREIGALSAGESEFRVVAGYTSALRAAGVDLADGFGSTSELMKSIAALTDRQAGGLDPSIVEAAKSGDVSRFKAVMDPISTQNNDGIVLTPPQAGDAPAGVGSSAAAMKQNLASQRHLSNNVNNLSATTARNTQALDRNSDLVEKFIKSIEPGTREVLGGIRNP